MKEPNPPTKVIQSSHIVASDGYVEVECIMDDGSIWRTDIGGIEWRKIKLSDMDLTHAFDTWNGLP